MWSLVLTVSLLCWSSEALVTCRDQNNDPVDWFIIYKAPSGLKSVYMNSKIKSFRMTNDLKPILRNTLQPIITSVRNMPKNFGFISYSDRPPGCQSDEGFGHSKGVVMLEKEEQNKGSGVWLLHSTPQFPFRRDQNKFWPETGNKNAQMFLCVTFPYTEFDKIGKHLQLIRALPFNHDIPEDFHQELKDVVDWKEIDPPSPPKFQELTSSGGQKFYSMAKDVAPEQSSEGQTRKRQRNDDTTPPQRHGDLYISIAQTVQSSVKVQVWRCDVDSTNEVKNSDCIQIKDLGEWKPGNDHSKWCVTTDQNKPWTCFADVNRVPSQFKRRGGALCIKDETIANQFKSFVGKNCPPLQKEDTGCDST